MLGLASQAFALDRAELDQRVRRLSAKFEALQYDPQKRVPAALLARARGIVLLDRTKAGFGFAYQGGNGVALVKDQHGNWSPAAFVRANETSVGFQSGVQQDFSVILLMTTNAAQELTGATLDFGGTARGTAGNESAGVENIVRSPEYPAMAFDNRNGLFGGVAVKSGSLAPDNKANEIYYGHFVTMGGILFDQKVEPTGAASALAKAVSDDALRYARK